MLIGNTVWGTRGTRASVGGESRKKPPSKVLSGSDSKYRELIFLISEIDLDGY